jgi:hypothetical protein
VKLSTTSRGPQWIAAIAAALPCFYLGYVLARVWVEPRSIDDGSWVRFGVGLMILEFLLLHSGAMMTAMMAKQSATADKLKLFFGLLLFYLIMVLAFAYTLQSMTLLWIFAAVSAGRLLAALTHSSDEQIESQKRIGIGMLLYLLAVMGSVFLPIPELGINSSILAEVYPQRGSGLWERQPERAIAAAAAYFLLLGLCELFILGPTKTSNASKSPSISTEADLLEP